MKVYLLGFEHGDYSDYECGVVGLYKTKEAAERALSKIHTYRENKDAYNKQRLEFLAKRNLARYGGDYQGNGFKKFIERRQEATREFEAEYPEMQPPVDVKKQFPKWNDGEFYAWDAEFSIVEVEVQG